MKAFLAVVTAILSLLVFLAIVLNEELRKWEFYPIAVLSLVDFTTAFFAYPLVEFDNFLAHHHTDDLDNYFTENDLDEYIDRKVQNDPLFFEALTEPYKILLKLAVVLPRDYAFSTSCVPWFILHRLNEYVFGPFMLIMAVERFIMVVRPFDAKSLVTAERRKFVNLLTSIVILTVSLSDVTARYLMGLKGFSCTTGFTERGWTAFATALIFFALPAICNLILYNKVITALLKSNTRYQKRNASTTLKVK